MIKTTQNFTYGGQSKKSDDPCNPSCSDQLCRTWSSFLCTFTGSQQVIADATVSGDKIAKMLPMAFVLIVIGLAVGLSKGHTQLVSK